MRNRRIICRKRLKQKFNYHSGLVKELHVPKKTRTVSTQCHCFFFRISIPRLKKSLKRNQGCREKAHWLDNFINLPVLCHKSDDCYPSASLHPRSDSTRFFYVLSWNQCWKDAFLTPLMTKTNSSMALQNVSTEYFLATYCLMTSYYQQNGTSSSLITHQFYTFLWKFPKNKS